jgi:type II secretory pathway predicted ATPase ExeA
MFLEFYGLKQEPFGVTPDPRFLFPTATHREALAALRYGIEAGRGFLALMAPPGMGKTTLLFRLLKHLQGNARTVFLFQNISSATDLMRYILQELGVLDVRDMVSMHRELNQILMTEASAGRRFVLVIDEAQNLSEPVLEAARVLSNFETPTSKLMQIVLAGQPELAAKLNRPSMSQLRQRISIFTRLEPFKPEDTFAYIEHRLSIAGREGPPLFTRAALELIAEHSQGIPRNINNLCSNSLSLGFAVEQTMIGPGVVKRVISDLSVPSETPKAPSTAAAAETQAAASSAPLKERKERQNPSGSQNRIFTQPPKAPTPATEPEFIFDEELQLAVMQLAPNASLHPPAPKPQTPVPGTPAAKTHAQEVPLGERIRWPASSLAMMGGTATPVFAPRPPAVAPTPQPAAEPAAKPLPSTPVSKALPSAPVSTGTAKPAVSTEAAAHAAPSPEGHVREIRLGDRFTLRINSRFAKFPEKRPLSRPEHSDYGAGADAVRPEKDYAEQRFFSTASWVLISLAFLLTIFIATNFWMSQSDEVEQVPSASPAAAAAPVPQATPSEQMDPIPHVIQKNESIESIARFYFGYWDPSVRAEIFKLNPNLNTKQLRVGQQILIPRKITAAPAAAVPQTPAAAAQDQARPYE